MSTRFDGVIILTDTVIVNTVINKLNSHYVSQIFEVVVTKDEGVTDPLQKFKIMDLPCSCLFLTTLSIQFAAIY